MTDAANVIEIRKLWTEFPGVERLSGSFELLDACDVVHLFLLSRALISAARASFLASHPFRRTLH